MSAWYRTTLGDKITHTLGRLFRPTHSENGGFGNISPGKVGYIDASIAGRIQYALPIVEKSSFENRPTGCVILPP